MIKLKEDNYYHIYNRGINASDLFLEPKNYTFFFKKYYFYTHLALKTYAYCLMRNHFHVLVKIRPNEKQKILFHAYNKKMKCDNKQWVPHGCNYETFKTQTASRQLANLLVHIQKISMGGTNVPASYLNNLLKESMLKTNLTSII